MEKGPEGTALHLQQLTDLVGGLIEETSLLTARTSAAYEAHTALLMVLIASLKQQGLDVLTMRPQFLEYAVNLADSYEGEKRKAFLEFALRLEGHLEGMD